MKRLVPAILGLVAAMPVAAMNASPQCGGPQQLTVTPDFSGPLPIADYSDSLMTCATSSQGFGAGIHGATSLETEPSPWAQSERELYQRILEKHKTEILVVPLQDQGYGFDRIERSLMTADLAYAIGKSGHGVADPWLVQRALGEGRRTFDASQVVSLAERLDAQWILYGYVGHDDQHRFTLTLRLVPTAASSGTSRPWQRDWRNIAFTDEQTPVFKFHGMLASVLEAMPLARAQSQLPVTSFPVSTAHVDVTPRALTTMVQPSGSALAALVTLGALGSPYEEHARERLFEHAVLNALNRNGKDPERDFLEAYAFLGLGRRPSALTLLASDQTPRAMTLRALLDGNLPAAEHYFPAVDDGLERLLLQLSIRDLQSAYGRKVDTSSASITAAFGAAAPEWRAFVQLRMQDTDQWSEDDPRAIKALLDRIFPQEGLDLTSLEEGNAVTHGSFLDPVDVDLANFRHLRRTAEHLDVSAFGAWTSLEPQAWDVLSLLENRTEARVVKHLSLQIDLQGLPQSALDDLTRYAPLLAGSPALESARARAAVKLSQSSPDDARASWLDMAIRSARIAAEWDPGQNSTAYNALVSMGIPSPDSQYMVDAYGHDYPRRSYWPAWCFGCENPSVRSANELQALAFSTWDISPLSELPPGDQPGQAGAAQKALGDRFTGNPSRPQLVPATSSPSALIVRLRAAIKSDPEPWENYWALGTALVESSGQYREASKVFLSFPGFRDLRSQDPVALSNWAADAGGVFYRAGLFDLAKPFYSISVQLNTGSEAQMQSKTRLELLQVDYPHAASDSLERGNRYGDAYAYRDYLSFLHAFGLHDPAWRAFEQLDSSFDLPQIWASALVGHRIQADPEDAVRTWLRRPEIRDAHFRTQQFAPYFAILWSATDRDVPADLGKFVEELAGPPKAHIDVDGVTLLTPHPLDPNGFMIVRASPLRAGKQPRLPESTPIESDLAFFADAYAALGSGRYAAAVDRFIAMADHYPIEGYPLAYFAYASAKSGDPQHLEGYLDTLKDHPTFDYWLARAYFAAARHDVADAWTALQMASRDRPGTDYRPIFTEYEYAQACEWLYQDTRDIRFVTELLAWVQTVEVSQPTEGWPYAMQYTYSRPGAGKTRALAMARYLDPNSKRIRSATESERHSADDWFKANNPFRLPSTRRKNAGPQPTSYNVP